MKFLILTKASSVSEETIESAHEEAFNVYGDLESDNWCGIKKDHIIQADSSAELYWNEFQAMSTGEIKDKLKRMNKDKKIKPFLKDAWYDAHGEKERFLEELKNISNFNAIFQTLNRFRKKAQFVRLSEFLGIILAIYEENEILLYKAINNYQGESKKLEKLVTQIIEMETELNNIKSKINEKIPEIKGKYLGTGENGVIAEQIEKSMIEYKNNMESLKGNINRKEKELESMFFGQIINLKKLEEILQKKIVAECNEKLKSSDGDILLPEYVPVEKDFSQEWFEKIKKEGKCSGHDENIAQRINRLGEDLPELFFSKPEEGIAALTTMVVLTLKQSPESIQAEKYDFLKDKVIEVTEKIKEQVIEKLYSFVSIATDTYKRVLEQNYELKQKELLKARKEKKLVEKSITAVKPGFEQLMENIRREKNEVTVRKAGIDRTFE